ncbi:hypothetical protein A2415_02320 [candidate division WWE3 bacterium RIFOXYC1_FULL_39_7]|uniref:HTH merR-type domain-containing protein n=2 Tax=Katanobacteria TaxID=422282 RepID=A0A1F4X5V3_UNCKA|nr:MAG: hypothetical protein A2415_02320 [candidate division WWE3 bacterium RIFOXYC1_FULL_39_7]OGC77052.1 MAG: hypothetical protein A2619_01495 [candidate division WWE3 bacterium RIFOXYD1_FULL_39_9]
MENLISVENLIEQAKKRGIDFGKGDPYNRLRYYTKIGWMPHMFRKKDSVGNIRGHYPLWAVERLIAIEELKSKGSSNDEIYKSLQIKNRFQDFKNAVMTTEGRNQLITYLSIILLVLILSNELGIVTLGKNKAELGTIDSSLPKQIMDSGTAFVPKNQRKIYIETKLIKSNSKVYVTFNQEYLPAVRYWVSEIKDYDGFVVELDTPVFNNSEFSWWITN